MADKKKKNEKPVKLEAKANYKEFTKFFSNRNYQIEQAANTSVGGGVLGVLIGVIVTAIPVITFTCIDKLNETLSKSIDDFLGDNADYLKYLVPFVLGGFAGALTCAIHMCCTEGKDNPLLVELAKLSKADFAKELTTMIREKLWVDLKSQSPKLTPQEANQIVNKYLQENEETIDNMVDTLWNKMQTKIPDQIREVIPLNSAINA